jgi:hypothetical protein
VRPRILDDERDDGAEHRGADEDPKEPYLAVKKGAIPDIYGWFSVIVPDDRNQPD